MRLRPHHLLCTQGYSGKGYNDEFIANMTAIVQQLRRTEPTSIEIVFGLDDLCEFCPHKMENGLCEAQDKVEYFDRKVVELFHIKEEKYIYQELVKYIDCHMTEQYLEEICHRCSWYPVSACKKNICGNPYKK